MKPEDSLIILMYFHQPLLPHYQLTPYPAFPEHGDDSLMSTVQVSTPMHSHRCLSLTLCRKVGASVLTGPPASGGRIYVPTSEAVEILLGYCTYLRSREPLVFYLSKYVKFLLLLALIRWVFCAVFWIFFFLIPTVQGQIALSIYNFFFNEFFLFKRFVYLNCLHHLFRPARPGREAVTTSKFLHVSSAPLGLLLPVLNQNISEFLLVHLFIFTVGLCWRKVDCSVNLTV
jgi:hypothetical protein